MIIHTSNPIAILLMLLIGLIDTFVFLACVRLVLGRITGEWPARVAAGLAPITDPVPQAFGRYLDSRRERETPTWLPWLCVLAAAVAARYALLAAIAYWL